MYLYVCQRLGVCVCVCVCVCVHMYVYERERGGGGGVWADLASVNARGLKRVHSWLYGGNVFCSSGL